MNVKVVAIGFFIYSVVFAFATVMVIDVHSNEAQWLPVKTLILSLLAFLMFFHLWMSED